MPAKSWQSLVEQSLAVVHVAPNAAWPGAPPSGAPASWTVPPELLPDDPELDAVPPLDPELEPDTPDDEPEPEEPDEDEAAPLDEPLDPPLPDELPLDAPHWQAPGSPPGSQVLWPGDPPAQEHVSVEPGTHAPPLVHPELGHDSTASATTSEAPIQRFVVRGMPWWSAFPRPAAACGPRARKPPVCIVAVASV
jgi:hypothetical protein